MGSQGRHRPPAQVARHLQQTALSVRKVCVAGQNMSSSSLLDIGQVVNEVVCRTSVNQQEGPFLPSFKALWPLANTPKQAPPHALAIAKSICCLNSKHVSQIWAVAKCTVRASCSPRLGACWHASSSACRLSQVITQQVHWAHQHVHRRRR